MDLEVRNGEIFGFLGPNGAGKSTTVRMLTTLLAITAGRAAVAGIDVADDPDEARGRIGVALQEAGLDPRQTGREPCSCTGGCSSSTPRRRPSARELLALVELEEAADRVIKGYSGGMQRRLDLAAALVHEPEVLFLDEPTTGLDPASRLTVWEELRHQRPRDDRLPDHSVPRGGRPTLRPARDHRPRQDRARREPGGAQGRPSRAPRGRRGADPRRRLPRRDRAHARPRRGRGPK